MGVKDVFLDENRQALREVVSDFMRKEVRPVEDTLPHDANLPGATDLERLQRTARAAGLWCIASPEKYGGAGMSVLQQVIVVEEASKCRMGAYNPALGAFGWDPPNAIFGGTEDQIQRYAVPTIERGEKTFMHLTEPSGGSDPARAIKTTATRTSAGWLINGNKIFVSATEESRWGIMFARTSPGRYGISCFVIERDTPGLSVTPIPVIRSWYPYEVRYENVEIPHDALLGEEGLGFQLSQRYLAHFRIPYAAGCIGVAEAAMEIAVAWAKERETFNSKLADKQAIQWMLADSEIELRAARLLVYDAAVRADQGQPFKVEASIAKVYATEAAGRIVDRCIQILGGMGVTQEMPLERWYRELRIKRIGEGPSEVHRLVTARHVINDKYQG